LSLFRSTQPRGAGSVSNGLRSVRDMVAAAVPAERSRIEHILLSSS
jgi:hypothetical protein